jgi:hypothetical protein
MGGQSVEWSLAFLPFFLHTTMIRGTVQTHGGHYTLFSDMHMNMNK